MSGVFVSYRRKGSGTHAYRLIDALQRQFGEEKVFVDVESIDPAVPPGEAIRAAVDRCSVVLVVIGPQWLAMTDLDGRPHLDDPEDWIRREAEIALGSEAQVIPVLLDGARMPEGDELPDGLRPLAELQAVTLAADAAHWKLDVACLVEQLDRIDPGLRGEEAPASEEPGARPARSAKAVAALVCAGASALLFGLARDSMDTETAVGILTLGLAGLGLAIWAHVDIQAAKTRGRGLAVTGIVLGVLVTLVGLGSIGVAAAAAAPCSRTALPGAGGSPAALPASPQRGRDLQAPGAAPDSRSRSAPGPMRSHELSLRST